MLLKVSKLLLKLVNSTVKEEVMGVKIIIMQLLGYRAISGEMQFAGKQGPSPPFKQKKNGACTRCGKIYHV